MSEVRRLGVITECLEILGHNITHAYDDLLFIEHMPFLLRFDADDADRLYFYAHNDLSPVESSDIFIKISDALKGSYFTVIDSGTFSFRQAEGDEECIDVKFYEGK